MSVKLNDKLVEVIKLLINSKLVERKDFIIELRTKKII